MEPMVRVGRGLGLIETMRVREGRIPWLDRHLARLEASLAALDLPPPREDLAAPAHAAAGSGDRVVRLEVRDGRVAVTTREVPREGGGPPAVIVTSEPHVPYPHKTTARESFERALAAAQQAGADDGLLVTAAGFVAEGTTWNLFWWDGEGLCTPAADLGILPGVGRARVMELEAVREVRVVVEGLVGRSLFLVNAVRGIVEVRSFQGKAVQGDARTAELSRRFWPD